MGKLSNSWSLVKASGEVLKSDKELIIFPVISGTAVLAITAAFALPLINEGNFNRESILTLSRLPFVFLYYLLIYFVIFFSNAALIGAALIRLNGGNPTVSDGIRIASKNFFAILGYAFISATVGIILRMIQEKLGLLGKVFVFLANFAWNVLTFLVVPVLIVEGISPVEAIKRSAQLLKKTWGEQIIGNISIGFVFGLIILGLFILFLPIAIITSINGMLAATIAVAVIFGIILLTLIILSSTLSTIYTAALYRYAAEGVVSGSFNERIIRDTFKKK